MTTNKNKGMNSEVYTKRSKRESDARQAVIIKDVEPDMDLDVMSATEEIIYIREWRFYAIVLDRLFFGLYFLLIAISLTWLFPRV